MKYFVVFLFLIGFLGSFLFVNNAYALWWPLSPEELIEQSGTIFVGTVTVITPVDVEYQSQVARNGTIKESIGPEVMTLDEYTVNVEEYLKNPQDSNTVTVLQTTVPGVPGSPAKIGGFEIGDRILFYLPEKYTTNSSRQYLPESFELPQQCDGKYALMQKRLYGDKEFTIRQDGIEFDGFKKKEYLNFTANTSPIQFVYGYDTKTMAGKTVDIDLVISELDSNGVVQKTVFNQTIKAKSEPCEWIAHADWEFVPKEGGSYQVTGIAKNIDEHHPIELIIGSLIDVSATTKVSMPPLQQFKSGIPIDETRCKEGLELIFKSLDGSPACVNYGTGARLLDRGWATCLYDKISYTRAHPCGPHSGHPSFNSYTETAIVIIPEGSANSEKQVRLIPQEVTVVLGKNNTVTWVNQDNIASNLVADDGTWSTGMILPGKSSSIMFNQTGIFEYHGEPHPWKKGMVIVLEDDSSSEKYSLDVAKIEDRYIHLNPVDMCATISLERLSFDEVTKHQQLGEKDRVYMEVTDEDLKEAPVLKELIQSTHHLDFSLNDNASAEMGLRELVDYEFFLMEKAVEKYGDAKEDYFLKLDEDLDERLADPTKQGFSNEFDAPQIVYNDKVYVISRTVFWTSDEHETRFLSVHLQDELKDDEKFVTLTDEDMKSIPKIKQAIGKIGTEFESVVAFKGMVEDPDWNYYRNWFKEKSTEQFGPDDKTRYVAGFVYEDEYYEVGFPIC